MTQSKEKTTTAMVAQQTDDQSVTQPIKDFNIDAFLDKRKEFITKVNAIMVDGKDYHVIQGKKSLAKGGAEKIASIFNWQAKFVKDTDAVEMFGNTPGLIAFICNLTKGAKYIGQGRGAAILAKNSGDPNKTLKMAQKSAFIDAVLRASGLSDFFTQDLENMNPADIGQTQDFQGAPATARPASNKQISFIRALLDKKGVKGVSNAEIDKLNADQAKKWIDKLLKMKDYDPTEGVDYDKEPFVTPQGEMAQEAINAEIVIGRDTPR